MTDPTRHAHSSSISSSSFCFKFKIFRSELKFSHLTTPQHDSHFQLVWLCSYKFHLYQSSQQIMFSMCTYKSREELFVLELMQKSRLDNFFWSILCKLKTAPQFINLLTRISIIFFLTFLFLSFSKIIKKVAIESLIDSNSKALFFVAA